MKNTISINAERSIGVIILAAGEGKRMHSDLPKVLHPICGKPLLWYVKETAKNIKSAKVVAVVSKNREKIESCIEDKTIEFVIQFPPRGTGDAVLKAEEALKDFDGLVIVLCGDVPLIKEETLRKLIDYHLSKKASATILTTILPDAGAYGRIVRKGERVVKIVESVDANEKEKKINEINSGIYVFDKEELFSALHKINPSNAQKEYYLTDTIEIIQKKGLAVYGFAASDWQEVMGINNRKELTERELILQKRIIEKMQLKGVTIKNPSNTRIDWDVEIGENTIIETGVELLGQTFIGKNCILGRNAKIIDSKISDGSEIGEDSNIEDAELL
ncbi:MAG: sugar phosphate nucleotidyltransferase [bacterium]